ncbi:MAG TPA: lysophospholipid acyltransferase family protein [Polyangia bacterium]|nr:lysophospholipid acyltransferase family protein [Polyangia bacterium]
MGATDWIKSRVQAWVDSKLEPQFRAKLRALPTRQNEYGFDPFGFNRDEAKIGALMARFFYKVYFRVETHGIERVPPGRVLLISNHSGQLPFDGIGIGGALLFDHDPPRIVRAMVEKYVQTLPFASYIFARWGQITGTPENCRRLLEDEEAILVFPEGAKGISKPFTQRYQLQEFGLGFMRLALETKTPIVPIAVIGAEEQAPAVNVKSIAKLIGAPAFPVLPLPPFFPILPYPVKYRIYFGEPLSFDGDADDEDEVLEEKVRHVRNEIQSMIRIGLKERRHIFW